MKEEYVYLSQHDPVLGGIISRVCPCVCTKEYRESITLKRQLVPPTVTTIITLGVCTGGTPPC